MGSGELERLFLLELMVYKIYYFKELPNSLGETIVKIKFRNYPVFEISEDDFDQPECEGYSAVKFKSGKSCLFSFRKNPGQQEPYNGRKLFISVFRKQTDSDFDYEIGQVVADLPERFFKLFEMSGDAAQSESLKDIFSLTDNHNETVGTICFFLRLSCFGKIIITQFQMDTDDNSYKFKGDSTALTFNNQKPSLGQTYVDTSYLNSFVPYGNGIYGPNNQQQGAFYQSPDKMQLIPKGMYHVNRNNVPQFINEKNKFHQYSGQFGAQPLMGYQYDVKPGFHRGYGSKTNYNQDIGLPTFQNGNAYRYGGNMLSPVRNPYFNDPNNAMITAPYGPFSGMQPNFNYPQQMYGQNQRNLISNHLGWNGNRPMNGPYSGMVNNYGNQFAGQHEMNGQSPFGNSNFQSYEPQDRNPNRMGRQRGAGTAMGACDSSTFPCKQCRALCPLPFQIKY